VNLWLAKLVLRNKRKLGLRRCEAVRHFRPDNVLRLVGTEGKVFFFPENLSALVKGRHGRQEVEVGGGHGRLPGHGLRGGKVGGRGRARRAVLVFELGSWFS
jgi:hypothetical protein